MKHTKNPELDFSSDGLDGVLFDPDNGTICIYPGDLDTWQADARLHKAAPKLLVALQDILNPNAAIDSHMKAVDAAKKLVKELTGGN